MEKKIAFKNDWCLITFGQINFMTNNAFSKRQGKNNHGKIIDKEGQARRQDVSRCESKFTIIFVVHK